MVPAISKRVPTSVLMSVQTGVQTGVQSGMHPRPLESMLARHRFMSADPTSAPAADAPQATAGDGTIHPDQWPELAWPVAADPAIEKRIDELLAPDREALGRLIRKED